MTTVLDRRNHPTAAPIATGDGFPIVPVNRQQDRALYATRQKIYPRLAHGIYRRLKWFVMVVTLGIYYGLPWLRWNRGPDLPDQAVLLDMTNNRFFFFFLEIWPQEFYFVTGLLILAALALFLITSAAGRVWCGYTCPQTVWTDLMIVIERFWQGDRNARIRLDKEPWGRAKIFKKTMTHVSWLAIGLLTGGALVFYFRDAPTLARELVSGTAPSVAYLFLGIFALTTYVLGGLAREQVCTYMCPWPRIQGAMTDSHTLLVSYRTTRGEPRGAARKGPDGIVDWTKRGDCIDCQACVAVCPAGIDIRDGSQLECIQCALCIDACDTVMDKIGRPRGLIAYDTVARIEATASGQLQSWQFVRPRTMLYAGLFALVGAIMLAGWFNRAVVEVNVLHDRNPPFVRLTDGSIRNGYTVKVLNKLHTPRDYSVTVEGVAGAAVTIVGLASDAALVRVATDTLRELRVLVTVPKGSAASFGDAAVPITIIIRDAASRAQVSRTTHFQLPPVRRGGHAMKDTNRAWQDPPAVAPHRQLHGRHVLALFVVFFGTVFAVNGYMLVSALSTYTGVVADEPYRKGLAYNERIASAARQDLMGWSDTITMDRSGLVTVRMVAKDGAPLAGLQFKATLGRAVTARGDMPLTFTEISPGEYRATLGPIDAGTWIITLEAYQGADRMAPYRAKRRLWLKS